MLLVNSTKIAFLCLGLLDVVLCLCGHFESVRSFEIFVVIQRHFVVILSPTVIFPLFTAIVSHCCSCARLANTAFYS